MPRISVVIPSFNHCSDLLKPCLESIKQNTDLSQVEVLVVANGCIDETREYVESLGEPFKLIWFDKGMGYTLATNAGIKAATGEYVVLLNNDTVVLGKNWLEILIDPFTKDERMGITGPMKTFCPEAGRYFLIFFCVCIKKEMFDKFGLLDEVFSPGYGEDTDFCAKVETGGYKIFQVCPSNTYSNDNDKQMLGGFPIFHKGNVTFKNWPGGEELLRKNNQILRSRYNNVNINRARKCDGFMNEQELRWLGNEAKKRKVIVEIGSWHGRSSRALGDNLSEGGVIYCVDTWNGSITEQETNHASAKWREGDHAFYEFLQNNLDLIQAGKIVPLRMSSKNAAELLKEKGVIADMVFIDAGHTYEELCQDIDYWADVVSKEGIFCGHDFNAWEGVNRAVQDKLTSFYIGIGTTIWYCAKDNIKDSERVGKPCIFDCFPFNNELDLLERRLSELYDTVDRFVIVEAVRTHANKPKELVFHNNTERFKRYLNKITYIIVEDFPATDSWSIERHQRDCIMRGLNECKSNDIIIISDCDEIPNPEVIKNFKPEDGIRSLEMDLYYFNEGVKASDKWFEGKILNYGLLKQLTPCGARYSGNAPRIQNAGKHLSYFGDVNRIIKKIEDTAHQEYNKPEFKDPEIIKKRIESGEDIFGRNLKFEKVSKS